jgi:5'-nucleotidase
MKLRLLSMCVSLALGAMTQSALASLTPESCPVPDTRATVVIGGFDTGVPNQDADGAASSLCTLNDVIRDEASWSSAAAFLTHVQDVLAAVSPATPLTQAQRDAIVAAANQSRIGNGRTLVRVMSYNDLHGNMRSPGNLAVRLNSSSEAAVAHRAGGIDYLSATLDQLKRHAAHSFIASTGDAIGASPLVSALFHDEVTIEAMNLIGTGVNVVGNHEFDEGFTELLRMRNGGCHPTDAGTTPARSCILQSNGDVTVPFAGAPFAGSQFPFLAANVVNSATGQTIFPATMIQQFGPVRVGFIGVVLRETPTIVAPSGVAGLTFQDEIERINFYARQLRNRGVESIVVLAHQGSVPVANNPINQCGNITGPMNQIAAGLDRSVDAIFTAHTHQAYICAQQPTNGGTAAMVSGSAFGRLVTVVDLLIDNATRNVVRSSAFNVPVSQGVVTGSGASTLFTPNQVLKDIVDSTPKYQQLNKLVQAYETASAPLASRIVGNLSANATTVVDNSCENQAGNLVADAQLAATQGPTQQAVAAFMNPGGVRAGGFVSPANRNANGDLTYGHVFTVQPFGNSLVTLTLTGAQIKELLEQQFTGYTNGQTFNRVLLPSSSVRYTWDSTQPAGQRVDAASLTINGALVQASSSYRVTVNSFLAEGGDRFIVLLQGTNRVGGEVDLDALEQYLASSTPPSGTPIAPPSLNRIDRAAGNPASCPNAL